MPFNKEDVYGKVGFMNSSTAAQVAMSMGEGSVAEVRAILEELSAEGRISSYPLGEETYYLRR